MQTLKHIFKQIIPPFIYNLVRTFLSRKNYRPQWNTLTYTPLTGIEIFFDASGLWQKKILTNTYDSFLFNRLASFDLKNKIIFDIGAHIGFHSIYFSKLVGENGKVFSFEPNQVNVERFKLILNKNKINHISVYPVAISDKIGSDEFTINEDIESGRSTGNFISSADTFWGKDVYTEKGFYPTRVKTVSIDSLKKELGILDAPDIIKIDVEGAEYLVLKGAQETLLSKKPILFIEVHSMLNMYEVITFLNTLSYSSKIINMEKNGPCFIEASFK